MGNQHASVAGHRHRLVALDGGAEQFSADDLKRLAHYSPRLPDWLHPKALDYNANREAWKEQAAEAVTLIESTQLELRALATYDT